MRLVHRRRPSQLLALVLIAVFAFTSCSSWQQTQTLVARDNHYSQLRVWTVGGDAHFLSNPSFRGDTLYEGSVAIPIDQIARVEAWRVSGPKTALLVVGVGAAAVLVAAAIYLTTYETTNCPRIHSWDGTAWRLDSGTYAGAIMQALARTDVDNLDFAKGQGGNLRLRVTGVPNETEHVDAIRLLVVDHDPQCTIAPDAAGTLHALGSLTQPIAARDFRRRDILRLVRANDDLSWESVPTGRDTARAEDIRDGLEIEFPRATGATEARLVVDGGYTTWESYLMSEYIQLHGRDTGVWYRALAADPAQARGFEDAMAREMFLEVSVWDGTHWRRQGSVPGAGPELSKRQVVQLDLSGVQGDTVRVRLEAAPSLWLIGRVAIDFGPERAFVAKEVGLSDARDSRGRDARPQLDRADGQELMMESSDSLELRFAVDSIPAGCARSYLASTTGWYRVHTSESADPDWTLADRLVQEPGAMSRYSVSRINMALQAMAAASH
jgi:hypothetical protein